MIEAVKKRSVTIAGHSTSLSLEEAFWQALKEEARAKGISVNTLIEEIDPAEKGQSLQRGSCSCPEARSKLERLIFSVLNRFAFDLHVGFVKRPNEGAGQVRGIRVFGPKDIDPAFQEPIR